MNKRIWIGLVVLAGSALLLTSAAPSSQPQPSTEKPTSARRSTSTAKPSMGVQMAQTVSTVTGVAISPLLGVSAVGAWKYFNTDASQRHRLPWFTRPWFWIPGLLLISFCFAKDVMGPAVPTALKKPMDAIELFENKISGLIAAGAFVPLVASIFQSAVPEESMMQGLGLAMFDPWILVNILTIPFAIAAFLMVWMVSHVINVLILVSPFATVDAALKSFRLLLLSSVTITAFANPYVGAAWSLALIVVAYFLAGWSFRLTVFGTVFGWDLLTLRFKRFKPNPKSNWMFTARKIEEVPVRTYGKLSREENGRLQLKYRRLLVMPTETLVLPQNNYAVGRGLLYPELMQVEGEMSKTFLSMPPRCRTHEEAIAEIYALSEVRDLGLVKGSKAIWQWLKGLFGLSTKPGTVSN